MFSISFRKQRDEKMENNLLTLIIKMEILFAHAITTSTARASSVSPSSYTNTIFNQSARVLSKDCFLNGPYKGVTFGITTLTQVCFSFRMRTTTWRNAEKTCNQQEASLSSCFAGKKRCLALLSLISVNQNISKQSAMEKKLALYKTWN